MIKEINDHKDYIPITPNKHIKKKKDNHNTQDNPYHIIYDK